MAALPQEPGPSSRPSPGAHPSAGTGAGSATRGRLLHAALGPTVHGPWPGAPVTPRVPKGPPQCPGALHNVEKRFCSLNKITRAAPAGGVTTPPRRAPPCARSGARRPISPAAASLSVNYINGMLTTKTIWEVVLRFAATKLAAGVGGGVPLVLASPAPDRQN
jgi:hypothetical protein